MYALDIRNIYKVYSSVPTCTSDAHVSHRKMSVLAKVRAVTFGALLFLSSFFGILILGAFLTPVLLVRPQLYRYLTDHVIGIWQLYIVSLLHLLVGVRVYVSGDRLRVEEAGVIMMNHRTRLDWMYLWMVLGREGRQGLGNGKIILKEHLKHIPGAGWAMQQNAFLFIKRNWAQDETILTQLIDYYSDLKMNTQILIFPEGTDLTANSLKKSDSFARKNGLPLYRHVMHPRTRGVSFVINYMSQKRLLSAVYDVTVAYRGRFPCTELQLLGGALPQQIHFHVRRHAAATLPRSTARLADWCATCWRQKEARLERFARGEELRADEDGDGDEEARTTALALPLSGRLVAVVCSAVVFALIAAAVLSPALRWLMFAQTLFYVAADVYGGLEFVQIRYFNRFFRSPVARSRESEATRFDEDDRSASGNCNIDAK